MSHHLNAHAPPRPCTVPDPPAAPAENLPYAPRLLRPRLLLLPRLAALPIQLTSSRPPPSPPLSTLPSPAPGGSFSSAGCQHMDNPLPTSPILAPLPSPTSYCRRFLLHPTPPFSPHGPPPYPIVGGSFSTNGLRSAGCWHVDNPRTPTLHPTGRLMVKLYSEACANHPHELQVGAFCFWRGATVVETLVLFLAQEEAGGYNSFGKASGPTAVFSFGWSRRSGGRVFFWGSGGPGAPLFF